MTNNMVVKNIKKPSKKSSKHADDKRKFLDFHKFIRPCNSFRMLLSTAISELEINLLYCSTDNGHPLFISMRMVIIIMSLGTWKKVILIQNLL